MPEKMLFKTKSPPFLPEQAWKEGRAVCGAVRELPVRSWLSSESETYPKG